MKKGFTLIELLVVVLIIGILAAIALPQYRMAVTKSRVASILPLMRRWKDALIEYKLQHGSYCESGEDGNCSATPDGSDLGVSWPSDWKAFGTQPCGDHVDCDSDYWYCFANEEGTGYIYCSHDITNDSVFQIVMYQNDDVIYEDLRGMMTCEPYGAEAERVCKTLGGNLLEGASGINGTVYKLN